MPNIGTALGFLMKPVSPTYKIPVAVRSGLSVRKPNAEMVLDSPSVREAQRLEMAIGLPR